jgi:hypothetical protein
VATRNTIRLRAIAPEPRAIAAGARRRGAAEAMDGPRSPRNAAALPQGPGYFRRDKLFQGTTPRSVTNALSPLYAGPCDSAAVPHVRFGPVPTRGDTAPAAPRPASSAPEPSLPRVSTQVVWPPRPRPHHHEAAIIRRCRVVTQVVWPRPRSEPPPQDQRCPVTTHVTPLWSFVTQRRPP